MTKYPAFQEREASILEVVSLEVELIRHLTELGRSSQVSEDLVNGLEKFVCVLYGSK